MSSKVLLLKYHPYLPKSTIHANSIRKDSETRTAIVLNKTVDKFISIQGYPPVPCKEKHKCWSLLQQAAKHLLAVPSTTSVYICFSDLPNTPISSLSTLLEQPSHLLELTVSPLPTTSINLYTPARAGQAFNQHSFKDTRDPYCRYREMYHHTRPGSSTRHEPNGSAVRQRCNFAEMNRLFSQLTEVNLSLQRTQEECEKIAQKCGPKKTTQTISVTGGDSTPPKFAKNQSNFDSDSGKGSSPPVSSNTTMSEETDSSSYHSVVVTEPPLLQASTADQEVERLIDTAKSLVQHLDNQKGYGDKRASSQTISDSTTTLYSNHSNNNTQQLLPDCPSNVCARPSFTPGGAYIMWNPVSLDAHDCNNGQKILGYRVFINGQLGTDVGDPLASQVELEDMKHNTDYQVQVCTHGEHSNSVLSQLLVYKHIESRQIPSRKSQPTPPGADQDSKTARVESWLKNGQLSVSTSTSHNSHPNTTNTTCTTTNNCSTHLYSHEMTPLGDLCEDTKSIGSSHTSGIVTDYPVSPKLHPACDCHSCSSKLDGFSCTPQHHASEKMFHHGNDALSMPSSHLGVFYHKDFGGLNSKSTSSTLCPSPMPSTLTDTVIDEPVNQEENDACAHHHRVLTATAYNSHHHINNARGPPHHHKGPGSPQQVRVAGNTHTTLTVTWSPVERDLKGCSNGCFVLGYRIYVNGTLLHSVDGAMTSRAIVKGPSITNYGELMYYVTTRSMSGESLPSDAVAYDSLLQRPHTTKLSPRSKKLDSVISSTVDSTSMFTKSESVASHLHSTSSSTPVAVASHPMSKCYRMESYV